MRRNSIILIVLGLIAVIGNADEAPSVSGAKPDPWVSAAPLIVAAVCRDGVALLAVHPPGEASDEDCDGESWVDAYRGPTRIALVDGQGTALVCAGWRPDAEWLAKRCRTLAADEAETFHRLEPQDVSLWMAQCAASDSVRTLSVVGLLCREREIYLVDVTGAHPMRAVAVGRGSNVVNARLCDQDFATLAARDGVRQLCRLLLEKGDEEGWEPLGNATRVELAVVNAEEKQMQRIRQPFLLASKKSRR